MESNLQWCLEDNFIIVSTKNDFLSIWNHKRNLIWFPIAQIYEEQ